MNTDFMGNSVTKRSDDNANARVGIDYIGVVAPRTAVGVSELSKAIGQDADKLEKGLGIRGIRWPGYSQNNSTMVAEAIYNFISKLESEPEMRERFMRERPNAIYYSTESNSDHSRPDLMSSMRMVYSKLLSTSERYRDYVEIFKRCDIVPVTFACAGAGLSLTNAVEHVAASRDRSAIVISVDTSIYDNSRAPNAEATQGAASTLTWVTRNPSLVAISEDVNYSSFNMPVSDFTKFGDHRPKVYGGFSRIMYIYLAGNAFEGVEREYMAKNGRSILDVTDMAVAHVPFPKQAIEYVGVLFGHYLKLPQNEALLREIASRESIGKSPLNGDSFTELITRKLKAFASHNEQEIVSTIESDKEIRDYLNWVKTVRSESEAKEFISRLHVNDSLALPSVIGNSYSSAAIVALTSSLSSKNTLNAKRGLVVFYGSGAVSKVVPIDLIDNGADTCAVRAKHIDIDIGADSPIQMDADQYTELHGSKMSDEAERVMSNGDLITKDAKLLRGSIPKGFHIRRYFDDGTCEPAYIGVDGKVQDLEFKF